MNPSGFFSFVVRQQYHRTKDVSQFCAGSQGSHGSLPGQSVWYRQPGFPAACPGGGIPPWHESCCFSGHSEHPRKATVVLERQITSVCPSLSPGCFQHHRDGPGFEPLPLFCRAAAHHQMCSSVCRQRPQSNNDRLHVAHHLPAVSRAGLH